MEKFYLAFIFTPFVLGLGLFSLSRFFNKSIVSLGSMAALLWMLIVGYFFYNFYFMGMDSLTMDWGFLGYSGFPIGMRINSLSLLCSLVNSILLLLTTIFLNTKEREGKEGSLYLAFILMGFVNCALMAKSLYTFFILNEIIFLIHYFCCCRLFPKEKIVLMRVLNTVAAITLFLIILYTGQKGHGFIVFFNMLESGLTSDKKMVFFGILFYFAIKLFFFPLYRKNTKKSDSLDVVNNLFVGNAVLILYIYAFRQYVVDVFPAEFNVHVSLMAIFFTIFSAVFCIFSLFLKNFLHKQNSIKKALVCLMLGAFLSFDKEVYTGIFTLLFSHIFGMVAFYVFFDGRQPDSTKCSRKESFLLAVIIYSLIFFPLSGNFVGFCKILLGYKSIHLYSLLFVFISAFFLFITLIKEFFKFLEKEFSEKSLLAKESGIVASICLIIIFLIGICPEFVEHFM